MEQESIIKYISGYATEGEKVSMVRWLDSDPEHMREFLAMRKLYDITLWQDSEIVNNLPSQKNRFLSKTLLMEVIKIAAIFIIALLGVRYFLPFSPAEPVAMQTIRVPAGQRAELTLTDGTKVWLNAKTTFVFPTRFENDSRKVILDGEGYFDVVESKKKPFIVQTGKFDVKVWGTEFNVIAYSENKFFETSLLKGSVEVLEQNKGRGVFIKPNERIYLENEHLIKSPISHFNHFLWKDGLISFDNATFPEMVKKLELYLDIKIDVKNKAILKYSCTGKFRTKDGIEHILKVLQLRYKFKFMIDDKLNTVTIL